MKKRYWIPAIVVIGVGLLVASKLKKGDAVTQVTVEKAGRGDITSVVTATGKVYPEIEVTISSEVAGEITREPFHLLKGRLDRYRSRLGRNCDLLAGGQSGRHEGAQGRP